MKAMNTKTFRAFLALGSLTAAIAGMGAQGCVSSRDARNGVFNENQYIKKSFLINGVNDDGTAKADAGWMIRGVVTKTSVPNPLGALGISTGTTTPGNLVRFRVTQDKLEMVSLLEVTQTQSTQRTEAVVDSWPASNVDLKYKVNLDGETTNFYEENQEQDWQNRQWVKFNPARNDLSDLNIFGLPNDYLGLCTDIGGAAVTLVPETYKVDEQNNYVQWKTRITLPLKVTDASCSALFAQNGGPLGYEPEGAPGVQHANVTLEVMYSMMRANPTPEANYKVLEIAEKDPIRHKYGTFDQFTITRDKDTGLLASRSLVSRLNTNKTNVYYIAPGFPERYKRILRGVIPGVGTADDDKLAFRKNNIKDETNKLLADAGAACAKLDTNCIDFKEWNDGGIEREYGDVRYHWIAWSSDNDQGNGFAGVNSWVTDPRTGERLETMINIQDYNVHDVYVHYLDAYLAGLGASPGVESATDWDVGATCTEGEIVAISPKVVESNHNNSSLYSKMQGYLGFAALNPQGPSDWVMKQDTDFFNAFYKLMPYQIFADPAVNSFVVPEGGAGVYGPAEIPKIMAKEVEFQRLAAKLDKGEAPFDDATGPNGLKNATEFLNNMRDLTRNHREWGFAQQAMVPKNSALDPVNPQTMNLAVADIGRHCVNGHFESKQEWIDNRTYSYWREVIWHEFGHSVGLPHNFMGSVDRPNFAMIKDASGADKIGYYSNSVMEYTGGPIRVGFWNDNWAPHDQAAIHFIYANNTDSKKALPTGVKENTLGIFGQADPVTPWDDKLGWSTDGKTEKTLLYCSHQHLKYTPFCRQGDFGSTPSEITAASLENYEANYQWRNFRLYRKFWNDSEYANAPAGFIGDMRRFILSWEYDWSDSELSDNFRRIGIQNPDPKGSQLQYYRQLSNKFNADASMSAQMVAAFHKAVIQQSSGERPYRTVYDKYYGDVTQQGIILDKFFAMQGFVALWPGDMYDPNQGGTYFASYSGIGDSSYRSVAEDTVASMVGGQYDVFPYFKPLAVAQFAQDTHSPSFFGRIEVRDWIGGHVFYRQSDFLDYFRQIAVDNGACADVATCKYDPRDRAVSDDHNEFFGPDKRQWIWAYVADRNQWVAVQKERNIASYIIVRNYTDDVIFQLDDGAFPGGAYSAQLPMKYFLDAFQTYN